VETPRTRPTRSLARRFTGMTVSVLLWMVAIDLLWDFYHHTLTATETIVTIVLVGGIAAVMAQLSARVVSRPLELLEEGMRSVEHGQLSPIQVSQTGDEIQSLGDSFNRMIHALAASQEQVYQHQMLLEERIRVRTAELEQAMKTALVATETKSEFLANMSHELRTPMNGLLGMLDLVLDGSIKGEDRESVEIAQRCAHSLLGLLNDILDLSKIEAGHMLLESTPFEVKQLMEDCIRTHSARASQKGIRLEYVSESGQGMTVNGDPLRLRQVVNNLLSNAVKFTDNGRVTVTQSVVAHKDGRALFALAVADTGAGIPPDRLDAIFQKFTQADATVARKYGGTGLGLSITRKLVELFGGTLRVESEVGKGSCFTVEVPLEIVASHPASTRAPQPEIVGSTETRARLLLVEDNTINQRVALAMLRKRGYSIELAENGQIALDILDRDAEFDVVLMDIQMPVLDGLETVRRIRETPHLRHLPVIAMTAHAMAGDRQRCLAAGMTAYLAKPLRAPELLATIERFVKTAALV
jgi:signal transduction histidine kinase/ActR/RegA family two-component response regulator